jgi:glycosyltransferase involved in cell wall biosynthesis
MPAPKPEPLSPPLSIWLVNPFDDVPGEGLPAMRYWSLARVLAQRGHDVTWWSANWSHRRKTVRTAPLGVLEDEGFAVRLVAVRPYENNVSLARLASHRDFGRNFERLAHETVASGQLERPDLIVASLPPLESPEAAVRIAGRLDAALVIDVQDLWPETFERLVPGPAFLRRLLAPFFLRSMRERRRAVLAAADAVSATCRTHLEAVGPEIRPDAPRHVCYLGSYLQEFPEPPRVLDAVPAAGASGQPPVPPPLECVYAGSLEAGQDLDALVAATRQLSADRVAATIHVAGTGSLKPMLCRAAGSLPGPCRIEVHGLLARADYVALLARCDVGLVLVKPESHVALPNKACDYAAAGLAIVNSLPGELARLVDEHAAGLTYAAGDGASLARVITSLAGDRRRLLAMRGNARRLAAAEFDRERIYPLFSDWLETVCATAPA